MIPTQRKTRLSKLAEFIANDFSNGNVTLLNSIAEFEDVGFYFDNYEDAFDGMLLYDNNDFHIHINIDRGNRENSKRGRFTFAHELGHFFIDEHRLGLKYRLLEPHSSFHNINQKSIIEEEADFFASCLLMPERKFKKEASRNLFSLNTIIRLSEIFQASVLATLIRFGEIGTHEIFAVISRNNIVQWYVKSKDFPNWKFKFRVGESVPQTTVVGEFYTMNDRRITSIEPVSVDDWFNPSDDDSRAFRQMYEQCYYADNYGYVISLIWFK